MNAGEPPASDSKRSAEVAVAIVSWNTRELLRRCLVSLEREARSGFARVCVVDNGSSDGSPEMVRADFDWVRLLETGENLGFGRAANLALADGAEPWVAPSNADIALAPGALRALVEAAKASPSAGLIAPRLVMPDGRTQHSVHSFPSIPLGLALHLGLVWLIPPLGDRLCMEGRWNPDRARAVDWAHGAFLLAPRAAFEAVGGFDARQWMYAEDLDLAWRLRQDGWSCRYAPNAVIHHEVSAATSLAFADGRLERHVEAAFDWMARRRGPGVARTYAVINWLGSAFRALALRAPARLLGGRFANARERSRRFAELYRREVRRRRSRLQEGSDTVAGR